MPPFAVAPICAVSIRVSQSRCGSICRFCMWALVLAKSCQVVAVLSLSSAWGIRQSAVLSLVTTGLDPVVHAKARYRMPRGQRMMARSMDCRVKPRNDEV